MNEEPKQNELEPVNMLLYCPNCFEQHVDKAEPDVCQDCGHYKFEHEHMSGDDVRECRGGSSMCICVGFQAWLNPHHKSHRCTFCNHIWRPADVPTNGVQSLATSGKPDGSPRPVAFANGKDFQESHADLQAKYDRLAARMNQARDFCVVPEVDRVGSAYVRAIHISWRSEGQWAVVRGGDVLDKSGKWAYEPRPSSRTDAFVKRTRYSLDEAFDTVAAYLEAKEKENG